MHVPLEKDSKIGREKERIETTQITSIDALECQFSRNNIYSSFAKRVEYTRYTHIYCIREHGVGGGERERERDRGKTVKFRILCNIHILTSAPVYL